MKKEMRFSVAVMAVLLLSSVLACKTQKSVSQSYPLDSLEGVIDKGNTAFDPAVSSDGKGSVTITAGETVTVRLIETGDLDVENASVIYEAKVKTDDLEGKAYLEMWCRIPGQGEFFSRGLDRPIIGPADWTSLSTPFFLKEGENPDNISLNLVIEGKGTVWIDDLKLTSGPLK